MRVLFSTPGLVGHVHPLVPLATALRTRGHDVRWAPGQTVASECSEPGSMP